MSRIHPFPLVLALVLSPVLGRAAQAQGAPRSMSDCERLKNDLAFNQCLSMFGPAAKNVAGGEGAGSGAAPPSPPPAAVTAAIPTTEEPVIETRRGRRGRRGSYTRNGRQSASFTVGGEPRAYRRYRRRR